MFPFLWRIILKAHGQIGKCLSYEFLDNVISEIECTTEVPFCCGSCINRYCCSSPLNELHQSFCVNSGNTMSGTDRSSDSSHITVSFMYEYVFIENLKEQFKYWNFLQRFLVLFLPLLLFVILIICALIILCSTIYKNKRKRNVELTNQQSWRYNASEQAIYSVNTVRPALYPVDTSHLYTDNRTNQFSSSNYLDQFSYYPQNRIYSLLSALLYVNI